MLKHHSDAAPERNQFGLVERGEPGSTYNICSGVDVSMADIAERLLAAARTSLELVTDPTLVRPVDTPALRGDPTLLRMATSWRPEIALEATLHDVLDYWRRQVG